MEVWTEFCRGGDMIFVVGCLWVTTGTKKEDNLYLGGRRGLGVPKCIGEGKPKEEGARENQITRILNSWRG